MNRPEKYNTKQRQAILSYLASVPGEHVTAGRISAYFEANNSAIGLTTIYRHLNSLAEGGLIRKYAPGDGAGACYQYIGKPDEALYFHMKCEVCGLLAHLDCETLDHVSLHILQAHAFQIDPLKTVLYGRCKACCPKE